MLRSTRIHRTAIAAALACALTGSGASALATPTQDLRNADNRVSTSSLAGTASPKQDLRSPDARDAAIPRRKAIDAPGATAADSATRPAAPVPATGDGIDWAPIGAGILGGLLAVGGIAALAGRRRSHRLRVAA